MQGWGVEIEGVLVTVSFYGNSDHNRWGGGLRGGGGFCKRCVRSGGLRPGIGLFYFVFYLSCNQVYAVIHVTKKGFYGVGGWGGGSIILMLELAYLTYKTYLYSCNI